MILTVIGVLAAVAVLSLLALSGVVLRRRQFLRRSGTIECGLRRRSGEDAGVWRSGLARYAGDELHWYRFIGFRPRPRQVIPRRGLAVSGRRQAAEDELRLPLPDPAVIEVRNGDGELELAMSSAAMIGFLAWLEAAPPGFTGELHG